jgi:hypothetical protein
LHEYFCGIFANTFFKREVEGATATTDRDTPEDPDLFLTRKDKADRLLTKILFPLGMGMLVGPLWILNEVQEPRARLGVITGFVVLFSTFVFLSTLVKTWELLAAAAA